MANKWEGFERRKFKRAKVNFIITYQVEKPLKAEVKIDSKEINALLLDLSECGIAISTTENIPMSTRLLIKLILVDYTTEDKDDRIKTREVRGEVRDNTPDKAGRRRIGISFTDLSDEVRQVITEFVKRTTR
ncbi:MAG: PilZ domain-containing protein [Omnitrophica bacterium]|nr:PilZ domain-containing protein [Candidatus Omnitrophota bacterium]